MPTRRNRIALITAYPKRGAAAPARTRRAPYKRKGLRNTKASRSATVGRTILPRRLFTKLKYVSDQIGTTTTTTLGSHQFRANGCFDPDLTGTGHQPYGYDQLTGIYNDYRVHAVHVKVIGRLLTSAVAGIVAVGFNGSSTGFTNLGAVMESVKNRYKCVGHQNVFQVSKYATIASIFGKSKSVIRSEADYSAGTGADPSSLAYVNVLWQNLDETTSTGWHIKVELTYFVEFNDLKVLGQS